MDATALRIERWLLAANVSLGLVVGALGLAGWHSTTRVLLTLAFVVLGPGHAVVTLLRIADPALRIALTLSTGVAVSMVLSMVMVVSKVWNPWIGWAALMTTVVAGGVALHAVNRER